MKGRLCVFLLVAMEFAQSCFAFRTVWCFHEPQLITRTTTEKLRPHRNYHDPSTSILWSSTKGEESSSTVVSGGESLPSKSTLPNTRISEKDGEQAFSAFYRQDPRDANADGFLKELSPSQRKQLQEYFQQLHSSRKNRDFETSDAICAKLRGQFGVRVYNDPPVWTTQKGAAPESYLRKKQTNAVTRLKERYGPRGHPYTQVGGRINDIICPLSLKDIHDLMSKLTLARMEGRTDKADAIQFELLINGVQYNDKVKQWRADGENQWDDLCSNITDDNGQDLLYREQQKSTAPETPQFTESRTRVEQLIRNRVDGIVRGDADLVHSLSEELFKTYSVVVDDKRQTWSFQTQGGSDREWEELPRDKTEIAQSDDDILVPPILFANGVNGQAADYSFRASDHSREVPSNMILNRIQYLVAERVQKREESKFLEADAIRRELWMTYYVGLNDRLRQWSVGGVFDDL